jgi:hypothetical protein
LPANFLKEKEMKLKVYRYISEGVILPQTFEGKRGDEVESI